MSEPTLWRTITKIENILKRCADSRLPGKQQLRERDNQIEVIIVDATETEIERPKETTPLLFGQAQAAHHQVASGRPPAKRAP